MPVRSPVEQERAAELDAGAWMLEAGQQYLLAQPQKENPVNPYLSLARK